MSGKRGGQMALPSVPQLPTNIKTGSSCLVYLSIVSDISIEKQGLILKETCFLHYVFFFWCHISYYKLFYR